MQKPKVVLVAGSAHGGTTIANTILGQHREILATGKLRGFPHGTVFSEENICSCGEKAGDCPFWSQVRSRFQTYQELPEQERIPHLFEIISKISGRPFVGDVAHSVDYARTLLKNQGIDLYLVHLVRNGPGVVWSRIRKDLRIGRLQPGGLERRLRVVSVSRRWSWHRRQFARMEKRLGDKAVRISYEDLCRSPRDTLRPVARCLGLDFDAIGERLGAGEPFEPLPHLLRGNAVLRTKKDVVLRYDASYLDQMPLLDRITVQVASRLPGFF